MDVTGLAEQKLRALDAHLSQHPDVDAMRRQVLAQMAEHHRHAAGPAAGQGHAEAFHLVTVNGPRTIAGSEPPPQQKADDAPRRRPFCSGTHLLLGRPP
ncbi:hypothetical protein GS446_25675 [Rhodococcus hoagii]|nr:hypothetical protein [Prescottella equi]